jgi:tight adherence protein C
VNAALVVLFGAVLGLGLCLVVFSAPALQRPTLRQRVAPYLVGGATRPRSDVTGRQLRATANARLLGVAGVLDRWSGGSSSVMRRLERLGTASTAEQFRVEQLIWGVAAMALAAAVLGARTVTVGLPATVPLVVLLVTAAAAGVVGRDRWLTHQVSRREARLRAELPTLAELLALSVAAGEGATAALERVSRVAHGELAAELARALDDVRAGSGLVDALENVARRLDLPELTRFVEGVVVAVDRGTPLSAVLQAQAGDVREAERRQLIETGGRKDIAMMVPVVFMVLPLSVLFALFPGFYGITLSSP